MQVRILILPAAALVGISMLAGCGGTPPPTASAAKASTGPLKGYEPDNVTYVASVGIPIAEGDPKKVTNPMQGVTLPRADPFALMAEEAKYDKAQGALALAQSGFGMIGQSRPEIIKPVPRVEDQPFRRLAGVMVGDSVTALIDMGDGRLIEIHPGQVVGDWQVMSIDNDKAVLHRTNSSLLPSDITVTLQGPNSGGGGDQNGGANPSAPQQAGPPPTGTSRVRGAGTGNGGNQQQGTSD